MRILLVAATRKEIEPFRAMHSDIDILITGVGVPATIYGMQKKLQQSQYDLTIQAGIAGSYGNEFLPGQVVLVQQDCFGDMGIEERGILSTIFEKGFGDEDEFPFTKGWLVNDNPFLMRSAIPKVSAVTVNKVTDDPGQTMQLVSKFSPQLESMEGAAFHFVCLQEKIPFIQIRAISNQVGERERKNWKIGEAVLRLNEELKELIEGVSS